MNDTFNSSHLVKMSLEEFLSTLSDGTATPGGGSAAALGGALAAALASMVARLTAGRRQYAEVHYQMEELAGKAVHLRERLAALVDIDAQAYGRVSDAYKLPRKTEEQQAQRSAAVQLALKGAANSPLEAARACVELLEIIAELTAYGNRNASTDAAVAALLAHAGLRGSVLNVVVNLNSIDDEEFTREMDTQIGSLLVAGEEAFARALAAVEPGD